MSQTQQQRKKKRGGGGSKKSKKPIPALTVKVVEPPRRRKYDDYDLDILAVAYSVHANLKNTPQIPSKIVTLLEQEKISWGDEEDVRDALCDIIEKHVVNKRNFENILAQAQRKRFFEEKRGIYLDAYPLALPNQ